MIDSKYNGIEFDEVKQWIRQRRITSKKEWDEIRLGFHDDEAGLTLFLEDRYKTDDWPKMDTSDWYRLVDLAKEAEDKARENERASLAAQINSENENSNVRVPTAEKSCWQLYRKHLKEDKDFNDDAIDNIEKSVLEILQRLSTNTVESGPIKGLVIGNVQSGKTANMAGLMAMAADYGWNMFIVLSGTIENLRRQTQKRLFDDLNLKGNLNWIGFNHLSKRSNNHGDRLCDLNLEPGSNMRYMTVCLKVKSRLNDLIDWIEADKNKIQQLKVLVIDDEADQAGIDTGNVYNEQERKAINKALQNLVACRNKQATSAVNNKYTSHYQAMNYISYTATPYANCLNDTHKDSLYPRHFIKTLPVSKEYFGPRQIFGSMDADLQTLDIVRRVTDEEVKDIRKIHKGESEALPKALQDSILWFICVASAMRYYGYKKPVSMLIHTSQKQAEHSKIADSVKAWFYLHRKTIVDMCKTVYEKEIQRFTKTDFRNSYSDYGLPDNAIWDYPDYEQLIPGIKELTEKMTSIMMDEEGELVYSRNLHLCIDNCANNRVDEDGVHMRLTYPEKELGYSTAFIVIGGNTLSRGLTLEGLVSTYFLRTVKQADTLMQMGRWFGYRRHYELMQRIWMTDDTRDKFATLADIDDDLREQLFEMARQGNKTPLEYAVTFKTSPKVSWLRLTAKNKEQMAEETDVDYSGMDTQLTVYGTDPAILRNNIETTNSFIKKLGKGKLSNNTTAYFWRDVSFETIMDYFFKQFKIHGTSKAFNDMSSYAEWVEEKTKAGEMTKWTVVAVGTQIRRDTQQSKVWVINDEARFAKVERSATNVYAESNSLNIGVLSGKKDYLADVDKDSIDPVYWKNKIADVNNTYKEIRETAGLSKTPLFLIYRIDKDYQPSKEGRYPINTDNDLIGITFVTPGLRTGGHKVKARFEDLDKNEIESEMINGD